MDRIFALGGQKIRVGWTEDDDIEYGVDAISEDQLAGGKSMAKRGVGKTGQGRAGKVRVEMVTPKVSLKVRQFGDGDGRT